MGVREGCAREGRAACLGSRPGHALERMHNTEGLATVTDLSVPPLFSPQGAGRGHLPHCEPSRQGAAHTGVEEMWGLRVHRRAPHPAGVKSCAFVGGSAPYVCALPPPPLCLPLPTPTQMVYAELLWVDRLGMYVSCEVDGQQPSVVRVPFLRPILD